jgi:hypothetical protein
MESSDRIKKSHGQFNEDNETAPAALVFQSVGPYEITSCHGEEALHHLERLRAQGRRDGFTAIFLGPWVDPNILEEKHYPSRRSLEEYLKQAAQLDVDRWLRERVRENPGTFSAEMGNWPESAPDTSRIAAHAHRHALTQIPYEVVYIAKIPTLENWQTPAYVDFGGWNDRPSAAVLTAVAKRWHDRFGTSILSATIDVLEFSVTNPPASREQAIELAKEHFIVCPDTVYQGTETISALAAALLNSNYWYFWWD